MAIFTRAVKYSTATNAENTIKERAKERERNNKREKSVSEIYLEV